MAASGALRDLQQLADRGQQLLARSQQLDRAENQAALLRAGHPHAHLSLWIEADTERRLLQPDPPVQPVVYKNRSVQNQLEQMQMRQRVGESMRKGTPAMALAKRPKTPG
jgi:hypothetical protein